MCAGRQPDPGLEGDLRRYVGGHIRIRAAPGATIRSGMALETPRFKRIMIWRARPQTTCVEDWQTPPVSEVGATEHLGPLDAF